MGTDEALAEAIIDLCWKATPTGATRDGDVHTYILPKGAVHRLVGAAQSAGILASLRGHEVSTDRDEVFKQAAEDAAKRANIKALAVALRDSPSIVDIIACRAPDDADPSHLDSTCWECGKFECDCR